MTINRDLLAIGVAAAVVVGAGWYAKKRIGAAVDDLSNTVDKYWVMGAASLGEAWQGVASNAPIYAAITAPDYPVYLEQANQSRDVLAGQYGPKVVQGTGWSATGYANPINDGFTSIYQSLFGANRTLGSDIYDWTH